MVMFATISSLRCFFLHPHRPSQEPVRFVGPGLSLRLLA
jgi:hypothetical protein